MSQRRAAPGAGRGGGGPPRDPTGAAAAALLAALYRPNADADAVLLCGPKPFMDVAAEALTALGGPREGVVTGPCRCLETARWPTGPQPAPSRRPHRPGGGTAATVAVELDGERHVLPGPDADRPARPPPRTGPEGPLLLPGGGRSPCACLVHSGELNTLRDEVLEEGGAGIYVLGCRAFRLSAHIEVTYD